jgi:UDP-N-acetylmuramyl pentapeptide synthase
LNFHLEGLVKHGANLRRKPVAAERGKPPANSALARRFVGAAAPSHTNSCLREIVKAAAMARSLRVVTYGRSEDCECRLVDYNAVSGEVTAEIDGDKLRFMLGAPGEHMALNGLAAIAAARALGHPLEPVMAEIGTFAPLAGRGAQFDAVINGRQVAVIDESYNANPGSMKAALELLGGRSPPGRRIAVLAEMAELGPAARSYHTGLAPLITANGIDRVHVIGELFDEFWAALPVACRGSHTASPAEMLRFLEQDLATGDCVLLKGSHSTGLHILVGQLDRLDRSDS